MKQPLKTLERMEIDASELMQISPPNFFDRHKQIVYAATRPEEPHRGRISLSRWEAMDLPDEVWRHSDLHLEVHPDLFPYSPVDPPRVDWYLNFADPHLFFAYSGALMAQDELQVAEHPALGALLEHSRTMRSFTPRTAESGRATPVLVAGVERRVAVHTDASVEEGRPNGLYGNQFAVAPPEIVRRAIERIDPPTRSNILAMAAPSPGYGQYDLATIRSVLVTAATGFSAAVSESERLTGPEARVFVHTGFWGCGAFGGNRTLMVALQLLAAHVATLDGLTFHAIDQAGVEDFERSRELLDEVLPNENALSLDGLLRELESRGFQWGVSDGN